MESNTQPGLTVGLIGLGLMGRGMGLSLLRAGHRLQVVANRRREVAEELCAQGAAEAATPKALAAHCDAVVLCLPSVAATESVLFGADGLVHGARGGLLVLECSTLLPEAGREFAARLCRAGIGFVDAPVTRGPAEAVAGRLNALVGGEAADVERAKAVLASFCERVFTFGPVGAGYAAKLVNNFLAFSQLAVAAEAMSTAARAQLDLATLLEAIQASGGQSRVLDGLAPWLVDGSPTRSRVTLDTAHKDVDYYRRLATSLGTRGPLADEVLQQLARGVAQGLGSEFTPEYVRQVAASLGARLPAQRQAT